MTLEDERSTLAPLIKLSDQDIRRLFWFLTGWESGNEHFFKGVEFLYNKYIKEGENNGSNSSLV